jgi:VPDSG-CTERM motif/Protein of unknown function (DUF642)
MKTPFKIFRSLRDLCVRQRFEFAQHGSDDPMKTPMKTKTWCMVLPAMIALLFFTICSISRATLISNGGFEDPVLSSGEDRSFATGSSIGGAWIVLGTQGNTGAVALLQTNYGEPGAGVNQFNAQEGLNSLDITGSANQGLQSGVEQVITTTVGQTYLLSFYVGRASGDPTIYGTPSTVDLSINGSARTSFTNTNATPGKVNWEQFSEQFVAAGTMTTLDFFNGETTNDFAGLDNVSISAVSKTPDTGTTGSLLGLSLVGLAFLRRKLC